jgi:hypothetical protein
MIWTHSCKSYTKNILNNMLRAQYRQRHSTSGYSLASHCGGSGSIPGQVKWDLWWTGALGWVFSENFGFHCQSSFHHHNHPGQATIGQSVATVQSGPSWTPPPTKRIKKIKKGHNIKHRKTLVLALKVDNISSYECRPWIRSWWVHIHFLFARFHEVDNLFQHT